MFKTLEEEKAYIMNGDRLCNDVKRQIGALLMNERVNKRVALSEVSDKIGVPAYRIEMVEMARRKFYWNAVAELLRYYNKRIEVRLVDVPSEPQ
ncbi:MAG: hypothetical protein NC218_06435 [Acetobacter sp.]|nr:hypothetical protein [Acetobacter sp.]